LTRVGFVAEPSGEAAERRQLARHLLVHHAFELRVQGGEVGPAGEIAVLVKAL
jgi:hypothetical protein